MLLSAIKYAAKDLVDQMSQSCGSTDSRCCAQILGREVKEEYTRTSEKLKCKRNAMELGTDQRVEFAKESSSTVGVDRQLSESRISRCSTNVRLTIQLMQMRRTQWNLCIAAKHSDILVMLTTFVLQLKRRSSEYAKMKRCSISMPDNAEGQRLNLVRYE